MEEKKLTEEKLKKFEELVERLERASEEKPHPKHAHPEGPPPKHPHPPVPHHHDEREDIKVDFKNDEKLLASIFGDEDTARAVVGIIMDSPTEIQIVLKVVIDLYNKIINNKGE